MRSVWSDSVGEPKQHPALSGDIKTDVLIIGAGLAGVLTAHRLRQAGVDCVLAESRRVGSGISGNTTAKITAQHGLIYADIRKRFGLEKARRYYEAAQWAVGAFARLSEQYPCDYETKTAYVYTISKRGKLEREAEAYRAMGLPGQIHETLPLPLTIGGALSMEGQAQFHPLKLLYALANELTIYENTHVRTIAHNTAFTAQGKIRASIIVLTSHFPLVNIPGLYFIKLFQHRSYVLALEGAPLPDGMFVDEKADGLSFRTYQNLLFVGGGDHKTGKEGGGPAALRSFVNDAFPGAAERFCWAAQDCMSLDAMPCIGRHRAGTRALFVASGFHKWGMTSSMVASKVLCDFITAGQSEWGDLYAPNRTILRPQLVQNALSAVSGLLSVGGPRCPHMGCKLHKNDTEGTWDCSCHGSRFDQSGHILDNPAKRGFRP